MKSRSEFTSIEDYEKYSIPELKSRLVSEFERQFDEMTETHKGERMFFSFLTMQFSSLLRRAGMRADVTTQLDSAQATLGQLEHWARMPSWDQTEAAALIAGLNPDAIKSFSDNIQSVASESDVARKFTNMLAIFRRGGYYQLTPGEVTAWAAQMKIDIPAPLQEAITSVWGTTEPEVRTVAADKRPRGDREQNLLKVIAGLWALSELPAAPTTTADKLSGLFDTWSWDGPKKGTIADTILKEAASIPGAVIRK